MRHALARSGAGIVNAVRRTVAAALAVVLASAAVETLEPSAGSALAQIMRVADCTPVMPPDPPRVQPRRIPNINEATYRRLSEAQESIDAEEYAEAMEVLNTMVSRPRRFNGNERAQFHNMLAYANYELDNVEATIHHYEQVLAQMPDISEGMEVTTLNQISKLYFQEGMKYEGAEARPWFDKALETMEEWMRKSHNPGPDAHFYIAQIYYQMKDFDRAIERLETVVKVARDRCQQVRENWWTMLQFLYFEKENWPKVVEILEILVREFPKRAYWVNLASVYGETGQTDKQLWTMEAAHTGGYLDMESDILTYSGLLLQNDIPNRGSKYLQQGIDDEIVESTVRNLSTLGQAYQLGQDVDKAIPVFDQAAHEAEDGEMYDRLAILYLEKGENDKCETAAQNALDKGGLKNELATRITRGICLFNLEKFTEARKVFADLRRQARAERARTEERTASQWVAYVDSERRRLAALEGP